MSDYRDSDRQIRLLMLMMSDLRPGSVCMNSSCQTGEPVPHMANDGGNHPHPYGLIESETHHWKRKRRFRMA